jgi:hypothetical protein
MPDALRFVGEVRDAEGKTLGEARFWGSADRSADGAPWRGWLHITDLGTNELPAGRYRVYAAGWDAEFEPAVTRAARVFETDLLPITGIGDAPWPDQAEEPLPYRPVWSDAPPRTADDRLRSGFVVDQPPASGAPDLPGQGAQGVAGEA